MKDLSLGKTLLKGMGDCLGVNDVYLRRNILLFIVHVETCAVRKIIPAVRKYNFLKFDIEKRKEQEALIFNALLT